MCFLIEMSVVVVVNFFLQDITVFVAAVFGIPYFLQFVHCTDDMSFPGNEHARSRQANNQHGSFVTWRFI
jgi:hypothetical protein